MLVLHRGSRLGGLAYVPYGPARSPASLAGLGAGLARHLPPGTVMVRFDLPWDEDEADSGLVRAPVDVQPRHTVVLGLARDDDQLLAGMHSKTRYNVRLALRKGVEVRELPVELVHDWYRLQEETARRQRIAVHSREYFATLLGMGRELGDARRLFLYGAYVGSELVAGVIVSHWGRSARYLYGASSNRHRNLMPNYALQWHAIRCARDAGCATYDLFGIPHRPEPSHPMFGLYRMKVGFGGQVVHRAGCHDLPLLPLRYAATRVLEQSRRFYFKAVRRRLPR